jgi:hypothetical protein
MKGGEKLLELSKRATRKREEKKQEKKSPVAGSDRLRLGPVGDRPMFENFNYYSVGEGSKEEGGLLKKMLEAFKGDRDYSQPINPEQDRQDNELGEAVKLLESIEKGLGKITPSETKLPSDDKEKMMQADLRRKQIRELIDLDNLPEIKEAAAKLRKSAKKKRLSKAVDTVDREGIQKQLDTLQSGISQQKEDLSLEDTMQGLADLERETFERFPYPEDPRMIEVYTEIGKMYAEEIGVAPIPPNKIHLLIYAENLDPNFKKFFNNLGIEDEEGNLLTQPNE